MTPADYNAREYAAGRLTRLQVCFVCGWDHDGEERWNDWGAISRAVGRFQARQGLELNGKAGPETRAMINALYPCRKA